MQVSMSGSRDATAFLRSVVKVAMPQRRGKEFPTKAMRGGWLTFGPPELGDTQAVTSPEAQRLAERRRRRGGTRFRSTGEASTCRDDSPRRRLGPACRGRRL